MYVNKSTKNEAVKLMKQNFGKIRARWPNLAVSLIINELTNRLLFHDYVVWC